MTDQFSEKRIQQELQAVNPQRTAVLVVDMLNEFLEEGGKMVLPGGHILYEPIQRLLDSARSTGMRVVWLNQTLPPDDTLFRKRVPHCIKGSWGAQVVDALKVEPEDITIPKRRYSGFFQTDLDLNLREHRIETVIVTGVVTNICVRSTIHDAFFLGYEAIVPEECVAATSPRQQEATLYDIDTHYGIVTRLDNLLAHIESARANKVAG
jgi:ureidoacrylate peracid hydrolase